MARKMKDSGIEWIGEIPEEWSKNKVIRLFDIIGSGTTPKNITSDFPVVNWIQSGDITGSFMPTCKNVISANLLSQYSALKVYPAPFIIIAMYGASVGNASISLIDGCVNQACCVLSSPSCNLHYAFYVIKSAQSYLVRKAVGGGQPNISQETIKQLWLPLPPLSTQDIIVRNLDATCSKIDDLLSSVHASIEEYKKLKQAVITLAVTKGVRGEREMKDSGVEWIGEIPAEWSITKIKSGVTKIGSGKTPSGGAETYTDSGVIFLRSQNIYDCTLNLESPTYISPEVDATMKSTRVLPDDVLLNITGGSIGRCSIVPKTLGLANVNQHVCIIRTNPLIFLPKYMQYFWVSTLGHLAIDLYQTGGNREGMSADAIRNTPIPYAPLNEQKEIADYLDAKCAEIDKLIAKKEQLVKELESYKKSLIYEVVTGKREV
mgnify:CR=1 FL=1